MSISKKINYYHPGRGNRAKVDPAFEPGHSSPGQVRDASHPAVKHSDRHQGQKSRTLDRAAPGPKERNDSGLVTKPILNDILKNVTTHMGTS